LRDFVLDWEDELPNEDLEMSHAHSMFSELSIVIGSTLQIIPAGNMPIYGKKNGRNGKLAIINLQQTKHDKKADLILRCYADEVFSLLFEKLGLDIPEYLKEKDPVKILKSGARNMIDWTQSISLAKDLEKKCSKFEAEAKLLRKMQKSGQKNETVQNLKKEENDFKEEIIDLIDEKSDTKKTESNIKTNNDNHDVKEQIFNDDVDDINDDVKLKDGVKETPEDNINNDVKDVIKNAFKDEVKAEEDCDISSKVTSEINSESVNSEKIENHCTSEPMAKKPKNDSISCGKK